MLRIRVIALCLLLFNAAGAASPAATRTWESLDGCSIVPGPYNDGDSFRVRHGDKEFIFRLYFVDAPEEDSSFPQRIDEQCAYFGIARGEVTDTGRAARDFVLELLSKPFLVQTRWHSAQGRSRIPRYYAFVRAGDTDVGAELVSRGLARVHGVRATTPDGVPANEYRARLLKTEDDARLANAGAWALSKPLPDPARPAKRSADAQVIVAPRVVAAYSTQLPRRRLADIPRETAVRVVEEFSDGWIHADYTDANGEEQDVYCLRWDLSMPEFTAPGAHQRVEAPDGSRAPRGDVLER